MVWSLRIARHTTLSTLSIRSFLGAVHCINIERLRNPRPIWKLIFNAIRWLGFSISGAPDFNQVKDTWIIIAGVTWGLAYEWLFYASLPLGGLLFGIKPSMRIVVASLISCLLIAFAIPQINPLYLLVFVVGAFASVASRSSLICSALKGPVGSLLSIASIVSATTLFPGSISLFSIALSGFFFTVIACGNTLFGFLTLSSVRMLGDISYSIYLLHGLVLYCAFSALSIYTDVTSFTTLQHWLFISILTIVLVVLSRLTYRLI